MENVTATLYECSVCHNQFEEVYGNIEVPNYCECYDCMTYPERDEK